MNNNGQTNSSSQWETLLNSSERHSYLDLFNNVDSDNKGITLKDEAMAFFSKSSIPTHILSEIWDAADDDNKGFLTAKEFYIVLKLIACAQHGQLPASPILSTTVPMPCFEGVSIKSPLPIEQPSSVTTMNPQQDTISPDERNSYIQLFQSAGPTNGILSGDKATSIFNRSNLPSSTLEHIWNLADTRKSGALNQTEFIIALHYISIVMKGTKSSASSSLPTTLPANVYAAAIGRVSATTTVPQRRQHSTENDKPSSSIIATTQQLCLTKEDYKKYRQLFQRLAITETGFVSGTDAVHFFHHSKLPETDLANIWDLVDTSSRGELSEQEFCMAMHLINRRMTGVQLPNMLPLPISQLIPSSMKEQPSTSTWYDGLVSIGDNQSSGKGPPPSFGNTATPQQRQQQQQQQRPMTMLPTNDTEQTRSMMESNLSSIQAQITTEYSLVNSLESQQRSMDNTLKALTSTIEREKQHRDELKRTANKQTQHLKKQHKKKDALKEQQQRMHVTTQPDHLKKNDITTAIPPSSTASPQQQRQSPPHSSDDTNVFSLSSPASEHELFAKVVEKDGTTTTSATKATSYHQSSPPSVNISEVEAKYPDLDDVATSSPSHHQYAFSASPQKQKQHTTVRFDSPNDVQKTSNNDGFDLSAPKGSSQPSSSTPDDLTSFSGGPFNAASPNVPSSQQQQQTYSFADAFLK